MANAPCPWCGYIPCAPLLFATINASRSLVCGHCGAYGPAADTDEDAITAWNTRSAGGKVEAPSSTTGVSRPDGKTFCGDTPMTPEKT